jgi:hypothetical protein
MPSPRLRAQAGSHRACRERSHPIGGGGCSYPLFVREGALPESQGFLENVLGSRSSGSEDYLNRDALDDNLTTTRLKQAQPLGNNRTAELA